MNNKPQNKKTAPGKPRQSTPKKVGKGNACPLYKKCGGCQLQNMTYDEQLSFKQAKTIKYLGRFGHVEEIIGMDAPKHYRNKVQAAFGTTRGGKIVSGVYQSSSHNIVLVDECMLEDKIADKIIVDIRKLLPKFKLTAYNEDTGKGFLRHVLVKRGFSTGEVMVVLVTGSAIFPAKKDFLKALLKQHEEITTVIWNINPTKTSLVLGKREEVLYGSGYIEDILCGKRFRISAKSFYQINPVQTEKLYGTAIEFAGLTGKETVLDAYCGIGTIGLVALDKAKQVIGVELNEDAVRDAIMNAKLNDAKNIRFFCDDAGKFMVGMAEADEKVDVVFMDPPRAGSDIPFLKSVATLKPEKVVYVSCNVETQARDLGFLCKNSYKVQRIQPVDMFPHTNHVECVVLLSRKENAKAPKEKSDAGKMNFKEKKKTTNRKNRQ
ncbi:MAG: 23S rRNA (uracil(1939)-C(5))-methyltransferase RlmD [Clostridia bacterium]|nr:23S rRNA (uracil(1939)-C(5))-methyltransferase RlmD [Clostridia bacterium]